MPPPSLSATVLAGIVAVVSVESGRRIAGYPFIIVCLAIGLYPLIAESMPGILFGSSLTLGELLNSFGFSRTGLLGVPAQTTGSILIGFLIFAGMMMATGAGNFFLNLCLACLGRFRGGPAKVAVVASGFFGSLSGTPIANVVATGSITIPTMIRMGYPRHYAGAIEAVASTGGVIMPPVMGSIAFLMVVLTDIPYATILVGAIIPAVLYYLGLLIQVDAYAARVGLKGLPREEIPSLRKVLKTGWPYLVVLAFLTFGLVYMRWGVLAAIYSSGLMFVFSFINREDRMTFKKLVETVVTIGTLITFIMAIMLPVGLIMIGITAPGTLTALSAELVYLTGENTIAILFLTMVVCYVFGMVGLAMVAYIVLAVTAMPSLVAATGLNLMALHLFMIYFVIMTNITPPVSIAAFVAAGIAQAPPMKTGFTAMRLAVVLFFIPFFFVLNPALILQGPIGETVYLFILCVIGIVILGGGLEGYILRVGKIAMWSRPLFVIGGFLIALPGWLTSGIGAALVAVMIVVTLKLRKTEAQKTL
jgi:TRAP transporter 4TM/12TM fusion protein